MASSKIAVSTPLNANLPPALKNALPPARQPHFLSALIAATLLHVLIGYAVQHHYRHPSPLSPPTSTVIRVSLVSLAPTPQPAHVRRVKPASVRKLALKTTLPLVHPTKPTSKPKRLHPRPAPRTTRSTAQPTPAPQPDTSTQTTPVKVRPIQSKSTAPDTQHEQQPPAYSVRVEPPRFNTAYLHNPPPRYPLSARRRGVQGIVIVRAEVSTQGRCLRAEISRSSGHPRLDHAALTAISQWRFIPARRGGHAVQSWVTIPVRFRLYR